MNGIANATSARRAKLVETGAQQPKRDARQGHDRGGARDRPTRRAAQQTSERAPLAARLVRGDESYDRGFEAEVAAEQQDRHPARRVDEIAVAPGAQQARHQQMNAEADRGAKTVDDQEPRRAAVQGQSQRGYAAFTG